MNNQAILWLILILPWLTLFFLKKEDIKRFMPVALFAAIASMIITDVAGTLKLWVIRETIFPLRYTDVLMISIIPVSAIWLYRLTYGRLWQYIAADAVLNLVFAFIFLPWYNTRGIIDVYSTKTFNFFLATITGLTLYVYQMWQEDALVPAVKKLFSAKIQPATTKPIFKNDDKEKNDR